MTADRPVVIKAARERAKILDKLQRPIDMITIDILARNEDDPASASAWYQRAAEAGEPQAMTKLGDLAQKNDDPASASAWYQRAAEAGEPQAMTKLGDLAPYGSSGFPKSAARIPRQHPAPDPVLLARTVQANGGKVVATGGLFDLLHVGHLRSLEAARRLGDCLIVCLNSDSSARRLKGPERPLIGQQDRAELLQAIESVDAVMIFDEDTPEVALERLRPDIWVKGGDYQISQLAEARLVESWGGQSVIVPYHSVPSSTGLAAALAKLG